MLIHLTQLKPDQHGIVAEIHGGHNAIAKIHSMGIREGKKIIKISSHFWRGPQTVKVGHTQISLGHGMAGKIMIEVAG